MNETIKKREKRYSTDIGKDSDDLIKKLQAVFGNKKITKKELIYRSLEYCHVNKLNLKELIKTENNIKEFINIHTKTFETLITNLKKYLQVDSQNN